MMKLFFINIVTFCLVYVASAQAPQGINYQGVARGLDGQPLSQKEISVRISILNGSANGEIEYDEIHEIKTNTFGLFTLIIGKGTPGTGSFNFIGWTSGSKWLQIELDENGGRNFKQMGSQQLMSVPYALYAERSGNGYQAGQGISINNNMITNIGDGDTDSANELISSVSFDSDNKLRITDAGGTKEADLSGLVGAAQNLSSVLSQGNSAGNNAITNLAIPTNPSDAATKAYVDNHTDGDASATNEIQTLNKTGTTLSLSNGGGSVVLNDDDPGNEFQTLSTQFVNANTRSLSISDGNEINIDVTDADGNATNEAQTLSRTGSNLSLSQVAGIGGGTVSIDDADANPINEAQTLSKAGAVVSLTNVSGTGGGSFTLNDDSNTNEAQSISRFGSNVTLTQAGGAGGGSFSIDDADANPTNEAQTLSKAGAVISLTNVSGAGGGSITLNDDSNTNEAQTISRSGSNVTLTQANGTGGGTFSVDDADASPTNEAQTISRTGNTVTLTNVSGTGGGTFTVDADETNELQNLNQVLTQGNSAGGNAISNMANPTNAQDATTKSYVDNADNLLNARISATYAFKATFNYTNSSALIVNDQIMPFTIEDFDDFDVLGVSTFLASEAGTYIFFVEGYYNTLIAGGSLSLLYNGTKFPVTIVQPFGATQPRFSGSYMFKLLAGETVSLVGDNIAIGAQFNGKFFGNKL